MKTIVSIILVLGCLNISYSQDIIIKNNSDEILAKIVEITSQEVKYRKFTNLEGPLYSLYKTEIDYIQYKGGEKEFFKKVPVTPFEPTLGIRNLLLIQNKKNGNEYTFKAGEKVQLAKHEDNYGFNIKNGIEILEIQRDNILFKTPDEELRINWNKIGGIRHVTKDKTKKNLTIAGLALLTIGAVGQIANTDESKYFDPYSGTNLTTTSYGSNARIFTAIGVTGLVTFVTGVLIKRKYQYVNHKNFTWKIEPMH